MLTYKLLIHAIFTLIISYNCFVIDAKLTVEKFDSCGDKNIPVKITAIQSGIDSNGDQLYNISFNITRYDIGENTKVNLKIFVPSPLNAKKWYKVFEINDNHGICHALNFYMYKVWFQIQKDVGMEPEKCPLKKDSYSSKSTKIQLEKLNLPVIPPGKMKVEAKAYLKSTNELFVCMTILLNNPN